MQSLLNFKTLAAVILIVLGHQTSVKAQDTAMKVPGKWREALVPDFAGLQYAGSIGYMSAGIGYDLFKKTNINLNYGYVSEKKGGQMHILALKFEYKPFKIPIGNHIVVHPFNPGVFASYTFAKELSFKFKSPQYPEKYYFWSEALRKHVSANSEIKFLNPNTKSNIHALGLYIEANANDIYMISWFENRTSIPFTDIFKLGYGLRVYF